MTDQNNKCSSCQGVFHPATGHVFSEKTRACGPCARRFFGWVRQHTNRRWGKMSFYDHVNQVSPPVFVEELRNA